VLREHLVALCGRTDLLRQANQQVFVASIRCYAPVYGRAKQGASYGHTNIAGKQVLRKGLSPQATTISIAGSAPNAWMSTGSSPTDAIDASDQQPLVNPQGTVAFWGGEAIAMGTAVGGVVVVAVSPSVIPPLDTIGAVPPLAVSSPSAVAKAPAAASTAPATSIARIFVDCCMNVPPGLCGGPPYYVRMS
jgi:hypothetical protein